MKELIAHTKIFDVIKKDEVMPGFRPVGIDAPDWVLVIAEKDGKFLMTRQLRWGIMKEVEEFVCGTVNQGEKPIETAKRELCEETGYIVSEKDFLHLGDIAPNPAFLSNTMHIFYVNLNAAIFGKVEADPGEHERLTSQWVDKETVLASGLTNDNGNIIPALKLCGITLYKHKISII